MPRTFSLLMGPAQKSQKGHVLFATDARIKLIPRPWSDA
ncbi:hypothetical protein SynMITS9220_02867 [Synechococcus sp. MIT S9220]|nr:hypothetical protein SynMITS9220_02867 [Synechococcus sp. MIT S9220]